VASAKDWIEAFRPRTLFLAVGAVVLGNGLAFHESGLNAVTFILTLLLAMSMQGLTNMANDLGDYLKGTDITGKRQGPTRTVQGGKITPSLMKRGIGLVILFVAAIGALLVLRVAEAIGWKWVLIMLGIGACAILAAVFYTVGKNAYGYKGWGDFFAFLFFGPVAVIGSYFLQTFSLDFQPVLPASGLGFISTMILNINNMRDIDNDRSSGKITVASRLGLANARIYHALLTFGMFTCFLQYSFLFAPAPWYRYLYAIVFLFQLKILNDLFQKQNKAMDPYLRLTSMSGLLLAIVFSICINI
jgi:1,4-dihydroxy-2-naphthoate octaprenyltransferase